MWTAVGVALALIVGLVLVIAAISVGFTFLLLPIVVLELLLLAAIFLIRQLLLSEEAAHDPRPRWYETMYESPPEEPRFHGDGAGRGQAKSQDGPDRSAASGAGSRSLEP